MERRAAVPAELRERIEGIPDSLRPAPGWGEQETEWWRNGLSDATHGILALIAEQPAIVVMPLEWRHDPGNGEGLYLGGLYLGGVVPQDDERYYSASSDAACFYENFEDEDRARVELEKAVRAALKDAGR